MLEFHEIANIFALIEGADFAELVDDIYDKDLLDRIVLFNGQILDGRNRYRALIELDWIDEEDSAQHLLDSYPDWFVAWDGGPELTPLAWVISKNARRRHETPSQRAMSAAKIETFGHGGDRAIPMSGAQDAILQLDRGKASEIMHVSERSVASAAVVLGQGVPELVKAVESGGVSVSAAETFARLPQPEQQSRVEQSGGDVAQAVKEQRKAPEPAPADPMQELHRLPEPQPHEIDCPHCHGTGKVMVTPATAQTTALENLRAARGKPVKPSLTYDERQAFETSRLLALVETVPDKLPDLQREYDVTQVALDYAMKGDADHDRARQLHDRMRGLLLKANGGKSMGLAVNKRPSGIRSANNIGGGILLSWGQEGSLWVKRDGLEIIVTAGPWGADGSFDVSFYAVDPEASFISQTGYRSVPQVEPWGFGTMSLEDDLVSIYFMFDEPEVLPETTYRLGRTGPVPVRKGGA